MSDERKPVWKTCLLVGCGLFLLLGAVAAVVVAMNWRTVSDGVSKATAMFGGLMDVQAAVQAHTDASDVKVSVNTTSGVEGTTLIIQIVNPKFLGDLEWDSPEARRKAIEVAVIARDALGPSSPPERYRIEYATRVGTGLTFTRTYANAIDAGALPAPTVAPEPR